MKIDILTLFPEVFTGAFDYSIVKRAKDKNLVKINLVNLRDFATDKYKTVDDRPYGGGAGMVMRVDIIDQAISSIKSKILSSKSETNSNSQNPNIKIILLDARGERLTQKKVTQLSHDSHLVLICGHYEGVDWRVAEHLCDEVISIGDFVLSGGELPAALITDSIVRLIPGVLGNESSLNEESFNENKIEYPQYTRPAEYKGWKVPEVLLSGDHKKIKQWKDAEQRAGR